MPGDLLSADAQAILLLCSSLALSSDAGVKPFTATEWDSLATAIHRSEAGRPGALVEMRAPEIASVLDVDERSAHRAEALLRRSGQLAFELDRLAARGIWAVTRADDEYPSALRLRLGRTAPPVLVGAGPKDALSRGGVAVVGSRDAMESDLEFATVLGRLAGADGAQVVSGAAPGVDTTAMLAAVDGGGRALGVTADALEKAVRRRDLRPLVEAGTITLVSPYQPSARFSPGLAMGRNKLIYCLSDVAVVVASGLEGGTWTGAVENLERGWVPLRVRMSGEVPRGNTELMARGGSPLERGDLFSGAVHTMVKDARDESAHRPAEEPADRPPAASRRPIREEQFTLFDPEEPSAL